MRNKQRKIGLVFGAVVLIGALVVPGLVAQSTPVRTQIGTLRLHLDNDGKYFRYDTATPGAPQSIVGSCPGAVTSLSGPQWVNLTAGTTSFSLNQVGLKDNGLGVKYLNCGRVDAPNWSVRIKLGTGIVGPGKIGVDRAELDLQGWGNATAVADLYFNGVKAGPSVTQAISGSGARAIMVIDRTGTGLLFNEIRLHPKNLGTSIALRGGGAGSLAGAAGTLRATLGTTDTVFRVVSETDHGPAAKIAFVAGPTPTQAGGTMSTVTVKVTDVADNPLSGESVTLASTGLASTPTGAQLTNASGIATFSGLTVGTVVGDYTMTASDAAASLTTAPASFSITLGELSIAFSVPPTDTIHDQPINDGDVEVTVEDGFGNPAPNGTQVDMSIGTDPTGSASLSGTSTGCTPPVGSVCALTSGGVATFSDLAIDTTSSGYQLEAAVSGLGSLLSGTFAITNTDSSCDPCEAEFSPGHTVSAPPGTTLIIETNQLFCEGFEGQGIAGTVTIIPDLELPEGTVTPVQFTDSITLPFGGPFPFCKAPSPPNPDPEFGHLVPLCNEEGVVGLDTDPLEGVSCVTQSVELLGGSQALLHSVLYVNEFDPPKGKH